MAQIKILRGKALTEHIAKIGKAAVNLQSWIQQAAVSASVHAFEHGNCTPINDLCAHAKFVTHNNAVMRWIDAYCPFVKYDTKEKAFVMNTALRKQSIDAETGKIRADDLAKYEAEMLEVEHYTEFAPPPVFVPVNVASLLKAALAKAEKADKADPRNKLDGYEDLKKLVAKLKVA